MNWLGLVSVMVNDLGGVDDLGLGCGFYVRRRGLVRCSALARLIEQDLCRMTRRRSKIKDVCRPALGLVLMVRSRMSAAQIKPLFQCLKVETAYSWRWLGAIRGGSGLTIGRRIVGSHGEEPCAEETW
jgi:hypothetical protein